MHLKEFWITNISKLNVSLGDLGLTIKARSSINLLDSKHYHLTYEQVINSAISGSIYKKQDKIKVRKVPPNKEHLMPMLVSNTSMPNRQRSGTEPSIESYETLMLSDEEFIDSMNDDSEQESKKGK